VRLGILAGPFNAVAHFFRHTIWVAERGVPEGGRARRLTILVARTLYIVVSGLRRERVKLRACLLTYVSLLSLVPLLAVIFSLFTAFGGLDDTQARLKSFLVDALAVQQRDSVIVYMDQFLGQTNPGKLGSVGFMFLFVTVLSLLTNVEKAMNDIWGLTKDRSILQRFQVYWPLVTLGPVLLGLSLSATAAVQGSDTVQDLTGRVGSLKLLFGLGPWVLTCLFFALLYQIMPNTKVRLKYSAFGGIVGGSLWTVAQKLFGIYAANAVSYSAIYGSLGAVPLFIIWVYVSWSVVLMGATLVFAIQSARTFEPERPTSQAEREFVAARLLVAVADRFVRGAGPLSSQALVDQVLVPPRLARLVLGELVKHKILVETTTEDGDDIAYVPGRPPEQLDIAELVRVMRQGDQVVLHEKDDPLSKKVIETLATGEQAAFEVLSKSKLLSVIETKA
jgi:membrane protein